MAANKAGSSIGLVAFQGKEIAWMKRSIASCSHPENKVSLGFVEGVNNKIRVLQRRAYGYRDEDYLKLKIVATFLPPLPGNANINSRVFA